MMVSKRSNAPDGVLEAMGALSGIFSMCKCADAQIILIHLHICTSLLSGKNKLNEKKCQKKGIEEHLVVNVKLSPLFKTR